MEEIEFGNIFTKNILGLVNYLFGKIIALFRNINGNLKPKRKQYRSIR